MSLYTAAPIGLSVSAFDYRWMGIFVFSESQSAGREICIAVNPSLRDEKLVTNPPTYVTQCQCLAQCSVFVQ